MFIDLKNINPNAPAGLLPPAHGAYPTMPLPNMPFVSPYQFNLMHQAAVQVALANQLQMARAKEGVALPSLPLHHIAHQLPRADLMSPSSIPALAKGPRHNSITAANLQ